MTDQKSQGKQFSDVLVNLKGVRPRQRHGDETQLYEPVRAAVEGGEVGRVAPLPRTEERARQRDEGHGLPAREAGR